MSTELTLPVLAEQINAEHAAGLASARDAIHRAIKVGELLLKAKARMGHGQFGDWIRQNCSFKTRMAQRYIQTFRDRNPARNSNAHWQCAYGRDAGRRHH
jgi:hypothetical protein